MLNRAKSACIEARKKGRLEEASVWATIYGEVARIGHDAGRRKTTDDELIRYARRRVLELREKPELELFAQYSSRAHCECTLLEALIPRRKTGAELESLVKVLIAENPVEARNSVGRVMKLLKDSYPGAYDGTEATRVIRSLLEVDV